MNQVFNARSHDYSGKTPAPFEEKPPRNEMISVKAKDNSSMLLSLLNSASLNGNHTLREIDLPSLSLSGIDSILKESGVGSEVCSLLSLATPPSPQPKPAKKNQMTRKCKSTESIVSGYNSRIRNNADKDLVKLNTLTSSEVSTLLHSIKKKIRARKALGVENGIRDTLISAVSDTDYLEPDLICHQNELEHKHQSIMKKSCQNGNGNSIASLGMLDESLKRGSSRKRTLDKDLMYLDSDVDNCAGYLTVNNHKDSHKSEDLKGSEYFSSEIIKQKQDNDCVLGESYSANEPALLLTSFKRGRNGSRKRKSLNLKNDKIENEQMKQVQATNSSYDGRKDGIKHKDSCQVDDLHHKSVAMSVKKKSIEKQSALETKPPLTAGLKIINDTKKTPKVNLDEVSSSINSAFGTTNSIPLFPFPAPCITSKAFCPTIFTPETNPSPQNPHHLITPNLGSRYALVDLGALGCNPFRRINYVAQKKKRCSTYRCTRCGQAKQNHACELPDTVRTIGTSMHSNSESNNRVFRYYQSIHVLISKSRNIQERVSEKEKAV